MFFQLSFSTAAAVVSAAMLMMRTSPERLETSPPAIVNGQPVDSGPLAAALAEAAGAVILEESALDAELERRIAADGAVLAADADQQELRALMDTLAGEAGLDAERAGVVLDRVRADRGLGPVRFAALLRRNARLRALVGPSAVSPEELAAALQMELGERVQARLITISSARAAGDILSLLRDAGPELPAAFSRLAAQRSEDAQAARGGVLPPLSPSDVSLPPALRQALAVTKAGLHPEVVSLGARFGVVMIEGRTPGVETPTAAQREQAERRARSRLERLAMDRLARDILASAKVTVFDDSLRWSWEHRPR